MYAASFGERDPETAAMACPVFGVDQKLLGALSVSGPRYRIEELGVKRIVPVLFKHARALTRTLGGDPDLSQYAGWSKTDKPAKAAAGSAVARATRPARRAAS
jgi:hypothetical protein